MSDQEHAPARIAVVGIGAIGGSIAAELADLGRHTVELCTRTPFDQLIVQRPDGRSEIDAPVHRAPEACPEVDWVLLATKAHQSGAAVPWLEALCRPGTRVAVLQNGVDHVERIAPLVAEGVEVLPVVVQLPAERRAPGRVDQDHPGLLVVPATETGQAFAALFAGARTRVLASEDFVTQAWWKLVSNAAIGGVCTLATRELGIVADPDIREIVLALMREVVAVGRAEGADLPADAPEKVIDRSLATAAGHTSSITVDRREGRRLEWEVRNAVVGRLGRRHGIETPWNDAVTALLRVVDEDLARDQSERRSGGKVSGRSGGS